MILCSNPYLSHLGRNFGDEISEQGLSICTLVSYNLSSKCPPISLSGLDSQHTLVTPSHPGFPSNYASFSSWGWGPISGFISACVCNEKQTQPLWFSARFCRCKLWGPYRQEAPWRKESKKDTALTCFCHHLSYYCDVALSSNSSGLPVFSIPICFCCSFG